MTTIGSGSPIDPTYLSPADPDADASTVDGSPADDGTGVVRGSVASAPEGLSYGTLLADALASTGQLEGADALDLSSIQSGSVRLEFEITEGKHKLDLGGDEEAKIKVKKGTTLTVSTDVKNDGDGPELRNTSLTFDPPIRFKNPGAVMDKWYEEGVDLIADADITGFTIDDEGKLELEIGGRLFGIGFDASDKVPEDKLPTFNLGLEDLLAGRVTQDKDGGGASDSTGSSDSAGGSTGASAGGDAGKDKVKTDRLLTGILGMLGEGEFSIDLKGSHTSVSLENKGVTLEGNEAGDARVTIKGTTDVEGGALRLQGTADVDSQIADVDATFEASLGVSNGQPLIEGEGSATVDLKDFDASLKSGQQFSVDGDGANPEITASVNLVKNSQGTTVSGNVDVDVTADAPIVVDKPEDVDVVIDADVHLTGSTDFSVVDGGLRIADGRFSAVTEGDLGVGLETKKAEGNVLANVTATSDIHVTADAGGIHVAAPTDLKVDGFEGDLGVDTGKGAIPISLLSEGSVIAGKIEVNLDGKDVRIKSDDVDVNLNIDIEKPTLELMGGSLEFDGKAFVNGNTAIAFDKASGFSLSDGQITATAGINDGELATKGLTLGIAEGSSVSVEVTDIALTKDGGLQVGNTKSGFEFRLDGAEVGIGPLTVDITGSDGKSFVRGSTELVSFKAGEKLKLREEGAATIEFELYGNEIEGTGAEGGVFTMGDGDKHFKGNATMRVTPDAVEIIEGDLEMKADLSGTRIERRPR